LSLIPVMGLALTVMMLSCEYGEDIRTIQTHTVEGTTMLLCK
jgi:hypothetical protein